MITCCPTASVFIDIVATPPMESVTGGPSGVGPSLKVTVPTGVGPGDDDVTVAVRSTRTGVMDAVRFDLSAVNVDRAVMVSVIVVVVMLL